MIGRVRGILVEKRAPWLVIELTNGLGYEIEAPMSTFYRLPDINHPVVLHIHQVVREDAHLLYGFFEERERIFFRNLIKVNGVGPKLALTILSNFDPNAFVICVTQNDIAGLTRVPGVGKKTAERLIIEMRDRLDDTVLSMPMNNIPASSNSAVQEAISALVALGYKPAEASRAVAQLETEGLSCEAIIRQTLQKVMA